MDIKLNILRIIALVVITLIYASISYAECRNLEEMLESENPRVVNYLEKITNSEKGSVIEGIKLCNGSNFLKDVYYIDKINTADQKQHILLFIDDKLCDHNRHMIAVAWVEEGGNPISIPLKENNFLSNAETAHMLSYDVFTWKEVQSDSGVVIISYPNDKWINNLQGH